MFFSQASNPGQFDNESDINWNKGRTPDSIFHVVRSSHGIFSSFKNQPSKLFQGRVGINTDSPDENLTVHGNIKLTGHIMQPSDLRVKEDIREMDSREQLKRIAALKMYNYKYKQNFADFAGLSEEELRDMGVLAQEVSEILPDAVRETGDVVLNDGECIDNFLVVNKVPGALNVDQSAMLMLAFFFSGAHLHGERWSCP